MSDIKVTVKSDDGEKQHVFPSEMGLSLMECLKAEGYDILATCGGMALCATCHVEILEGYNQLSEPSSDEWAMLDTLPNITPTSRLSCQIKLNENCPDLKIIIRGEGQ
ncbi:MAG: (2Fe-2S)-binding protein [Bacteroidia bacterium]|nr:(2Fe-2S)-binding protein [Bacteroidia bacterium]